MIFTRILRTLAAFLAVASAHPAMAQGDLLVAPTRVVIEGSGSDEVILNNIGDEPATYRISLVLRRMTEEGELVDVEEADASEAETAALSMFRYAPRRVTLPPNQPQSIRIAARPGQAPDGEYRVHMLFRAIPKAVRVEDEAAERAQGIAIQLRPVYGITIPLIVRKGRLASEVSLDNVRVVGEPGSEAIALDVARTGDRSVYGEFLVFSQGGDEPIALVRGIGVYPEIGTRPVAIPLRGDAAAQARNGPVRIEYREFAANGGGLIAEIEASLP
ncbi:molecular chaperone [Altererythrobacter halimionae]|uniref:Molecular chaperone n=2 Tax=Alteriqipengyuania halimionae TaxID=1926630 RepID=A0A6I4U7Q2_9SPHN|nr:molecular chaperone [Alteriqipengyuania halimionae]